MCALQEHNICVMIYGLNINKVWSQTEEKDSIVKIKHMNMLKVLHELHFALDLKLKELTQNNFNNADEIKRLRAIEQESKEQIAHQRHEINSLKRLLQESRADVARVDRAGGYR